MAAQQLIPRDAITPCNDRLVTTSQKVAEVFGKLHKDVLRRLNTLDCSQDFTERNFTLSEYKDSTGRKLTMYQMTKDGFMFLVMGFTGKKAAQIKEAYINAFNEMAEELEALKKTSIRDRSLLREAVKQLAFKHRLSFPDAYRMVHQRFGVAHIDEIERDELPKAVEYIHNLTIHGEYIAAEKTQPAIDTRKINFPFEDWKRYNRRMAKGNANRPEHVTFVPANALYGPDRFSPLVELLTQLDASGFNVDACAGEYYSLQHFVETYANELDGIRRQVDSVLSRGLTL